MAPLRMDNAAIAFFGGLGRELEGRAQIEGIWADQTVGLDGVRSEIVMGVAVTVGADIDALVPNSAARWRIADRTRCAFAL